MMDTVNHPSHYTAGRYEVIDIIESITGDQYEGFLVGNVIKYVARYKHKNGIEDLRKAKWYLYRLINYNIPGEQKAPLEREEMRNVG